MAKDRRISENMKTVENLEKESYQIEMNIMSKLSKYKDEHSSEIVERLDKLHKIKQQISLKVCFHVSMDLGKNVYFPPKTVGFILLNLSIIVFYS